MYACYSTLYSNHSAAQYGAGVWAVWNMKYMGVERVQVDSVVASLVAVRSWVAQGAKMALIITLGLLLLPLLAGSFTELIMLPLKCVPWSVLQALKLQHLCLKCILGPKPWGVGLLPIRPIAIV